MNKDNAKDYLPLVQALADGKTIQCKQYGSGLYEDISKEVNFDSTPIDSYRIKPEPIERWMPLFKDWSKNNIDFIYNTKKQCNDEWKDHLHFIKAIKLVGQI